MSQELINQLVTQIEDLKQRVAALEEKEFAVMHGGIGDPAHAAAEGVFYWDHANDALWINTDGNVTWMECCVAEAPQ